MSEGRVAAKRTVYEPKIQSLLLLLLLAGRICNCRTPKNSQTGNLADAVLGATESPEQLGYHSENNGPHGRVRSKKGSCGPKVESVLPRTSLPSKAILFFLTVLHQCPSSSDHTVVKPVCFGRESGKSYRKDGRFEEITLEKCFCD